MGNSKIIYNDETLIDLTEDTVSADTLLLGATAHDASGEEIIGIVDSLKNPYSLTFIGGAEGTYDGSEAVTIEIPTGAEGGTTNYNELSNLPTINGVTIQGDLTSEDLGIENGGTVTLEKLTFTGAVSAEYDGSEAVTVEIPSGGASVTVDSELSADSENPVQNKIITAALSEKADADDIPEIPDALPNPNALTFTGAVTGTYDGSKALEVNIPVPAISAFECGSFQVTASSGSTTEYTHTFETPYDTVPFIFINLVWTGSGVSAANNLFATLTEVTETGFTVRVYSNDSSNRTVAIRWLGVT